MKVGEMVPHLVEDIGFVDESILKKFGFLIDGFVQMLGSLKEGFKFLGEFVLGDGEPDSDFTCWGFQGVDGLEGLGVITLFFEFLKFGIIRCTHKPFDILGREDLRVTCDVIQEEHQDIHSFHEIPSCSLRSVFLWQRWNLYYHKSTICVGKNFKIIALSHWKSLYLLLTLQFLSTVSTLNNKKLVDPIPKNPPVVFLIGLF